MNRSRSHMLVLIFVLFSVSAWVRNDEPPGDSLANILSGHRVMVAYTPPRSDSPRSAHFMPILCEMLYQELSVTCVNIFGDEGELLQRAGINPKAMYDEWMGGVGQDEGTEEYHRGLRLINVKFGILQLGGVLRPIMHFFWEGSYIIEIQDLEEPNGVLAHVEGAGGKWGLRTEGTWQGAYRNAARDFVRKLEGILVSKEELKIK